MNLEIGQIVAMAEPHANLVMTANIILLDRPDIIYGGNECPQIPSVEYKLSPQAKNKRVLKELEGNNLGNVPVVYRTKLRDILKRQSSMFDGSLGEMKAIIHKIEVTPDGKQQLSHPCRENSLGKPQIVLHSIPNRQRKGAWCGK